MSAKKHTISFGEILIAFMAICVFLGIFRPFAHDEEENPRYKNGIDTIVMKDSTYYIHFRIDSAVENEIDPSDGP